MVDSTSHGDKSTWVLGREVILGRGVDPFFVPQSALQFVGSLLGELCLGLLITAMSSNRGSHEWCSLRVAPNLHLFPRCIPRNPCDSVFLEH